MDVVPLKTVTEEERLVAELELFGIRYLSRQTDYRAEQVRPPAALLADLIRQPSARVRASAIAVLLSRPECGESINVALERLRPQDQVTLRLFYTAAVFLQQEYALQLQPFLAGRWHWLPDLFSAELGLPAGGTPGEKLAALSREHRRLTQATVNWLGTYEDMAHRLLRRWVMEAQWSR